MRIMILGGDGYLGWATAMHFAARGEEVCVVDNYLRRTIARETDSEALTDNPLLDARCARFAAHTNRRIRCEIFDLAEHDRLFRLMEEFQPDCAVHYAEQPSAPYSMKSFAEAKLTLDNNLTATHNLIWAVLEKAPDCHIVKLGTMGEYGTPNIDIEEGWIDIEHKGRREKFLYPRQAGSLYHTTKVLDTDLLWFYVRTYGLRVTDLMQGPVYGLATAETDIHPDLGVNFHYDDIFGTVVNRFIVQAIAGIPLTVYGKGGQTRGYLNLIDTLQCIELAARNPVKPGELRIANQFTELFSVNDLAERVKRVGDALGLRVAVDHIDNPRREAEEHYYNVVRQTLPSLGLQPHPMSDEVLADMIQRILPFRERIVPARVLPRVAWKNRKRVG